MKEAADTALEAPSIGEEAGVPSVYPHPENPENSGRSRPNSGGGNVEMETLSTSTPAAATTEPDCDQNALVESPLRTVAVEPTPRNAMLSPEDGIIEEARRKVAVAERENSESPRTPSDRVLDCVAVPHESTLPSSELNEGPSETLQKLLTRAPKSRTKPEDPWFASKVWPLGTILGGQESRSSKRFSAARYAGLGDEPETRKENLIARLATEAEKREIARRRKLASGLIVAELLRLDMEASVYLELDNLERQRSRIQAHEDEEEERWRRIEKYHLHASTPLHLRSQRDESLGYVLQAEERERAWRLSQDSILALSNRSRSPADDSRRAINAELSKVVWPAVESQAPAGEEEAHIPPSRSRHDPTAVLFFCLMQVQSAQCIILDIRLRRAYSLYLCSVTCCTRRRGDWSS